MRFDPRAHATTATCALTISTTLLIAALNAAPAVADVSVGAASAAVPTLPANAGEAARATTRRVRTRVGIIERRTDVRAGSTALVAGRVRPRIPGRLVLLQRRSGGHWTTIARSRTGAAGRYVLRYRTSRSVSFPLRVRAAAAVGLRRGTRRAGRLEAFRPALASWYGQGQRLACGGHLTPRMMGVAHRSLPCGTRVTIRYRGREVRVPVVDRGPYAGGREFDLGPGVRAALRFDGVGTVHVAY